MEYKSTNSGLLSVSMVKNGDKLILIEDAYSTFVEARQVTYWNVKVQLPDGSHKLASLFESFCDTLEANYGSDTSKWTGHTVSVEIKTSRAGKEYISMNITNDPIIDVEAMRREKFNKEVAEQEAKNAQQAPSTDVKIEYPKEEINPNDIPF